VALLGESAVPFEYAGVRAGNVTRGLRPFDSPEIELKSADAYLEAIRKAGIVLDTEARKALIAKQVREAAASAKGEALLEDELLDEVTNLVEKPTAVLGGFDPVFLELPRDVLISVMKKHQRYFPVTNPQSTDLLPFFIAIRNGDEQGQQTVREGNEHVLGARFTDADFFVRADLKQPLEAYRSQLATLIFQTKLGSMLDKSERTLKLSVVIADMLGLDPSQRSNVQRATFLAKADLATQMVTEMTSLQGIIGREYALRSGEHASVAQAIGEQYQTVPQSKIGLALALTDRIDSLVGLFAAGLAPTGAKDPYGLRRAALGVVQPLLQHAISFDLRAAVEQAAGLQPITVSAEARAQVLDFVAGRLSVALKDAGYKYDVVDAVLAEQAADPAAAAAAVKQLQAWVARDDWSTVLPAFARCVRITRDHPQTFQVNEKAFAEKEEKALFAALQKAEAQQSTDGGPWSVDRCLKAFVPMIPAVDAFFDKVLVMAEDRALRENRLGLLQRIAGLSRGVADLSKLEGF
jgi:glycyl-tRNA synthetase